MQIFEKIRSDIATWFKNVRSSAELLLLAGAIAVVGIGAEVLILLIFSAILFVGSLYFAIKDVWLWGYNWMWNILTLLFSGSVLWVYIFEFWRAVIYIADKI